MAGDRRRDPRLILRVDGLLPGLDGPGELAAREAQDPVHVSEPVHPVARAVALVDQVRRHEGRAPEPLLRAPQSLLGPGAVGEVADEDRRQRLSVAHELPEGELERQSASVGVAPGGPDAGGRTVFAGARRRGSRCGKWSGTSEVRG